MAHSLHTERSIHEMLKDTPPMNESGSAIHSGTEGRPFMPPNSLPLHNHSGLFFFTKAKPEIFTSLDFFQHPPHR